VFGWYDNEWGYTCRLADLAVLWAVSYRPVVACVDGSEESLYAAQWAAREAQRHEVPLRIVSAADELCGESARTLSEAVARSQEVSSRLPIEASPLIGPPASRSRKAAPRRSCSWWAPAGPEDSGAMLLGSVSRYAAMHAACPLIVVREGICAAHLEVIVGARDLEDTGAIMEFAFGEAKLRDADPGGRPFLARAAGRDLAAGQLDAASGGGEQ